MSIRLLALPLLIALVLEVCPADEELDIHTMVVGDQLLSLKEDRQLTFYSDGKVTGAWLSPDGKYVAYLAGVPGTLGGEMLPRLCLMRSSGGRSTVLVDGWQYRHMLQKDFDPSPGTEVWVPSYDTKVVWSPDSRSLAVRVDHGFSGGSGGWLWVYSVSGERRAAVEFPMDFRVWTGFHWSPDSRRLAAIGTAFVRHQEGSSEERSLLIVDVSTGAVQTTVTKELGDAGSHLNIEGWNSKGTAVMVRAMIDAKWQLRETDIEDGTSRLITEDYGALQMTSPNGIYRLDFTAEGIDIENLSTRKTESIALAFPAWFVGWSPDSRMFSYALQSPFSDGKEGRSKKLNSVWLSAPEARKAGRMCVVLDFDEDTTPVWSPDYSQSVYVSKQRIHIAEVGTRTADTWEKIAGGIPLDEEEEKQVLANNAKQIGTAIQMYNQDWDEKWPPSDGFPECLYPYLRNEDVFLRPGTDDMVFQYYQPPDYSDSPDTNPAETVLGVIDVGYGWMIVLYADGHVAVVPKK